MLLLESIALVWQMRIMRNPGGGFELDPFQTREHKRTMKNIRNICVYCGSSPGNDPIFRAAAETLGLIMARQNIGLVYGGGGNGLMGVIARSVHGAGGHVTGIIPDFLQRREHRYEEAQEIIVVPDMHTRKRMMFERADAIVALPGGVGTLEELVEQLTWVQLDQHDKPVVIADIGGFWRPLLDLFAHMRNTGFIRADLEVRYMVAEKIEDVVPMIETAASKISARREMVTEHDPRL
ncbi:MAG: Rossman fold protein family [Hyphomicrobiales bacterium]|nr:Rossman fold protein family [Hyphomicrobiales bacterium]